MTDEELGWAAQDAIHGAAVMARFPRYAAEYDAKVDLVYAECRKRARGIYQRAYNAVVRAEGHYNMAHEPREGDA